MDDKDKSAYIQRYEKRLKQFGYSPMTLGWGKNGRQEVRFQVLTQPIVGQPKSSVLDVGCGFGDLYRFLKKQNWCGHYTGIDVVPGLLKTAREIDSHINVVEGDITSPAFCLDCERYDYVVASGVFNAKLEALDNEAHIAGALKKMYDLSKVAVCVDFLSTYVDFQNPEAYHTNPLWAFELARRFSRRAVIRHDYMAFEFALIIYKDDSISSRNVFQGFERTIDSNEES